MIRYDRLWVTMEACGMTQYRLIKRHNFSAGQIGRLKKNMHVSTHTLDTLCTILGCGICDIIEYVPEGGPEDAPDSGMPLASSPALPPGATVPDGSGLTDAPSLSDASSLTARQSQAAESPAKAKKSESPKGDKSKKAGKSKKGDKKSAKEGKEGKKSKDSKKNK
ncbi:MAG: helix-turn-helix domain-containing protein [Enterocloster aldenensis]|uniref:helix-turn-helix domain-containing protein n=1 Tax=Enterocloster aldenensis TaxID=358742 RepID=UPI0035192E5D